MNKQINKSCFVLKSLFWFCGVLKKAFFKAVFFYVLRNFSEYRTSPNKRSRFLFDFEVLRCHAYWKAALKKGCAYFKVRQIVHMKFQNFSSQQIVDEDVPRTLRSNVRRTSPKDPIWASRRRPNQSQDVLETSRNVLIWRSRNVPEKLIRDVP